MESVKPASFTALPLEIQTQCLSYLDLWSWPIVQTVSKSWKAISNKKIFAKSLLKQFRVLIVYGCSGSSKSPEKIVGNLMKNLRASYIQVEYFDASTKAPELKFVLEFHAILVFQNNAGFDGPHNALAVDNVLVEALRHGIGITVGAYAFCRGCSYSLQGYFAKHCTPFFVPMETTFLGIRNTSKKLITVEEKHPILYKVKEIYGNDHIYIGDLNKYIREDAKVVATFDEGTILVATYSHPIKVENARKKSTVVGLNIFPVPLQVEPDGYDSTWTTDSDGIQLIINCLLYSVNLPTNICKDCT